MAALKDKPSKIQTRNFFFFNSENKMRNLVPFLKGYLSELVPLDTLADDGAGGGEGVATHEVHGAGQVEEPGLDGQPPDDVARQYKEQQHRDDDTVRDLRA
jgi:hypothetical protein